MARKSDAAIAAAKMRAEELYVNTQLTQGQIADIVGVAEKTMSDWINANNKAWRTQKAARSITKERIIAGFYAQLAALNDVIAERETKYPTSAESDVISKITKQITVLQKEYNFGTYHTVLDEFTDWLTVRDQAMAASLTGMILDFLKTKSQKLK